MSLPAPESSLHRIRWVLAGAWLLIIGSLFHDPWSARFTEPDHPWSPLRLPADCIPVQGVCLTEQPYALGTTLFWGAVVPSAIFILLVFGHELWRRICPLSFLSQIPRALGLQRQRQRLNPRTGELRQQLARVPADSWLGRHYPKLQFGWLFLGLCGRILFFNADRLVLAGWLLFTIAAAISVGWLYGGKSWCQYFCPMAPVQSVYSTPSGLLGSQAHTSEQPITQSMCRTVLPDGTEQSACVACQQPCIDIDAERMYWARLDSREFSFERYGYVGLVVGYFLYYYLYAGNWAYYFSGAWARQQDQLSQLLDPGLYLFGQAIAIPKLMAVPLVLGLFTALGVWLGRGIEAWWRSRQRRRSRPVAGTLIRHRVFVVATFLVFNVFFLFAGRPLLLLLPAWVQYLFDVSLVAASTLWLHKAWRRNPELYSRENLASRFRRQLERLELDVARFLDGRSLADLSTHEVYVLAKVLPGFTREKRLEAYKGVVREALEEGYVNGASSLEVLQQMRLELSVSDDEHRQLLEELGVEDPSLLDPDRRRSLEDQIRLSGYRKALERLMLLQRRQADPEAMQSLRRKFSVSDAEETTLLGGLSPTAGAVHRAEALLDRLPALGEARRVVQQPDLPLEPELRRLMADTLRGRCELSIKAILDAFTALDADSVPLELAARLRRQEPELLSELLESAPWSTRLEPRLLDRLAGAGADLPAARAAGTPAATLHHLETLVQDPNPLVQAGALLLIARLDPQRGRALAGDACGVDAPLLLRTTAVRLQAPGRAADGSAALRLADFPELEKRVFLAGSDFFHGTHSVTLDALAEAAELRRFAAGELITEAGDTCRELLLLIEGEASVRYGDDQGRRDPLRTGQVLDELEVLTHSSSENTIVADRDGTRVLAVPVDAFDAMLDRDPDFARRVLELESRQLQRFMRSVRS
jgi:hypothetical protein